MSKSTGATNTKSNRRATVAKRASIANARKATASRAQSHGELEVDEIDYAPAIAAVDDLFSWAFDLAERNVADWPEGKRRVKNARRYLRALMHSKAPRRATREEDLAFTAALLARIFDEDLGLGLGPTLEIFEDLRLPTVQVPNVAPKVTSWTQVPIDPARARHLLAIFHAMSPTDGNVAHRALLSLPSHVRDRWIDTLSALSVPAAVALLRSRLPDLNAMSARTAPTSRAA